MPDVSELNAAAHKLHVELSDSYDSFVLNNDVKWKFLRCSVFRFGFNEWVKTVVMLRACSQSDVGMLYRINYSDGEKRLSNTGKDDIASVFIDNVSLYNFFHNEYLSGGGFKVEQDCLRLIVGRVKPSKFGASVFLECVASGMDVSQVSEFAALPSSYREGFYS